MHLRYEYYMYSVPRYFKMKNFCFCHSNTDIDLLLIYIYDYCSTMSIALELLFQGD